MPAANWICSEYPGHQSWRGQAEGTIRADIDPEILGKACLAVMDSMATPSFLLDHDLTLVEFGKIIRIIIQGLMVKNRQGKKEIV